VRGRRLEFSRAVVERIRLGKVRREFNHGLHGWHGWEEAGTKTSSIQPRTSIFELPMPAEHAE
jgi:hypothetical protein